MASDGATAAGGGAGGEGSVGSDGGNAFDSKMDKGSADLYFHYYGMLQHQQNMLQVGV
jgi:histone-arginine methyltransferase CARM1